MAPTWATWWIAIWLLTLLQVTDSREVQPTASRPKATRQGTRVISVDNVLQYASEIPSAQRRLPPGIRPAFHTRTPSGRHPLDPKLRGVGVPLSVTGAHLPARTSKTSEKLVLLPETTEEEHAEKDGFAEEDESAPPSDEALSRRKQTGRAGKSDAERLPKSQRFADPQLARVTAYCTAQSYKLRSTAQFVRDQHGAKTKLYDDCLYCVYQLPLLGGSDGYRVRSSPVVKNPGGRSVLDEQIEANERREYREGWHEESDEYSVRHSEEHSPYITPPPETDHAREHEAPAQMNSEQRTNGWRGEQEGDRRESNNSASSAFSFHSPQPQISPDAHTVAELFIFSYGVAVLWNFTGNQEKDLLADLTFSSTSNTPQAGNPSGNNNNNNNNSKILSLKPSALAAPSPPAHALLPLMTRPLDEDDFETEEFHFQYDGHIDKPRIYNDMITLRTSDHMIKLAMAHAIAQSTKLSFFEERMQRTMSEAQYVPRRLALEGRLGMSRKEVVSLVGRLFEGRVDVNLSSNMLDTPNFFWDSEPTLHPLYQGVREYLEIKPRIQVLNERCRVFLDLAEILSDSVADTKMTRITWIVIILIVLSILVTVTEVFLRFALLAAGRGEKGGAAGAAGAAVMAATRTVKSVDLGVDLGMEL
ncbi:hypothetical protein LTR36_004676 [Oleoguttula mirabilis]|uniref:DUF155 domain-containing protein n=1 Tax=Oleoguttula mirabilis TaxID=1507867 RepID=A0AAV9JG68_9PEZI|nr:hypothetical protein LTR36_004676 [Oleoguttula mirabilis]